MSSARSIDAVLATVRYDPEHLERLRMLFGEARFIHADPDDAAAIADALTEVDVAILAADLDARFPQAPRLRWVHCDHSGLNGSARPEVLASDLIVTGSAGRSAPALAQHAFFFALTLTYDGPGLLDMQRAHVWRGLSGWGERRGLYGKTIGVVGLGHTGVAITRLARAFGMSVLGYGRRPDAEVDLDRFYSADRPDALAEILAESDVVVLCIRMTDQTHHLIGERELGLMKSSAFLINLARGPVVDTEALVVALTAGQIAGAGLDVFETEPLPPDAPIWDAPNLVITPHQTAEMPDLASESLAIIGENVQRYLRGDELLNMLKPEDVYTGPTINRSATFEVAG